MALHVEVVSPERILWAGEARAVTARTVGGGDITFLTGHAPFVGALEIGRVTVLSQEGPDEVMAVHGGFVEVSNDRVTVLSDVAELASGIDVERARAARTAALGGSGDAAALAALRRAELRLDVAGAAVGA